MAVVHWPVTLAEDEQRNFDEVVDDFRPEYPGILNWLIEGAKIYLSEGLIVPRRCARPRRNTGTRWTPSGHSSTIASRFSRVGR